MIYFENFTILIFLLGLVHKGFCQKLFRGEVNNIYFIDSSPLAIRFLVPLLKLFGKNTKRLDFKMMDIVDSNNELVRIRIAREDLINFKRNIVNSVAYKAIQDQSWDQDSIKDYLDKFLVSSSADDEGSIFRTLFIINTINWHVEKFDYINPVLIIEERPWFKIYYEYAEKLNITLLPTKYFFHVSDLKQMIWKYPWLYRIIKNSMNFKVLTKKIFFFRNANLSVNKNMLFLEGRGNINLLNDGLQSDFFWQLNSSFPKENIILQHHNEAEKEYLFKNGMYSISTLVKTGGIASLNFIKPKARYLKAYKTEFKSIKHALNVYSFERNYWSTLFKKHDVRIFFSFYKYSSGHIAQYDAIHDNGGISIMWQMALDTYKNSENQIKSDISFVFSKFSSDIDQKLNSKSKYTVIAGYPQDHVSSLLKDEAQKLRERLMSNGARKIIFAIDENSGDDDRWHTGHVLQRENYSFILQRVLETPWLGVVFKPKASKTLRKRLGPIADLLKKAETTGRCHVYDDSTKGRHSTIAPVILAGLSADVCIHGHMSAGTAALECALEGIPTLLINREGVADSKLLELPKGSVIFEDWPACIDALMGYLDNPNSIDGFGDWSLIIDEFDPFRDGKAAYRIGTYMHWLNQGMSKGLDKETVMLNCAARYREEWGDDKVINA